MLSDKDKKALQCTTSSHTDEEYAALKERYDMMRQLIENLRDDLDIPSNETGLRYRVGILIDDNAALEAQVAGLREAVEVLSGPANGWVDYCMLNKILPRRLCDGKTLDTQCREAIAKEALDD